MNIWLIQTGEPLPIEENVKKMRTALLAYKLVERGHSVIWWTSAFDHLRKEWIFQKDVEYPIKDDLTIMALIGLGYKRNISVSRFLDHRLVSRKFRKKSRKLNKPDIIITSIPPHDLAYEAVEYGRSNKIPVLVDIRDPWPDMFVDYVPKLFQKLLNVLLYKDVWMTRRSMQMADGLIAVTNMFLEWGLKYAGRKKESKDKIFPLGYEKHKIICDSILTEKYAELTEKIKNKFVIFFIGTLSKSYHNPSVLLRVAEQLKNITNIHFVIAGDGELFEELRISVKNISNVSLTGWLNRDEIEFWLKRVNVGICPATRSVSLPTNKAYAYLSAGLPIISAFQGDLKELIDKYQLGFYYQPGDVDALVNNIIKLYNNTSLYNKISVNARRVFDKMFDAERIYEKYAEHIETMAEGYSKRDKYSWK
jgi:glycosyltransferase involved in cell wall biosynthesis